jgi:hypothetical protein
MDAHSRNLEEEEILEDIINDAPDVEPAESPSSYLNPSGDGMEVDRHEDEADGEGDSFADGEAGGQLTKSGDEGMTNRPSIFSYLVFGPGGITVKGIARPIKTAAWRGSGVVLRVQAKARRVQVGLVFD